MTPTSPQQAETGQGDSNPMSEPVEVSGDPVEQPDEQQGPDERVSGWNPWCCRECGLIPRFEVDVIGGEYDYRHIVGHEEGEEPEAFTISLRSGWATRSSDATGPWMIFVCPDCGDNCQLSDGSEHGFFGTCHACEVGWMELDPVEVVSASSRDEALSRALAAEQRVEEAIEVFERNADLVVPLGDGPEPLSGQVWRAAANFLRGAAV